MRARGPNQVKPRQLRVLVILLALLPLIPISFVLHFLFADIASQRLEAREHARPIYQKLLESNTASLAAGMLRQLPPAMIGSAPPAEPWALLNPAPGESPSADALLLVAADGKLSLPPAPPPAALTSAATLARAVVDSGAHQEPVAPGPGRWRFFSENPEPIFALHRHAEGQRGHGDGGDVLLLRTRQHLIERIATYYQKVTDPQTCVRLLEESGEGTFLTGPYAGPAASGSNSNVDGPPLIAGDPLAEVALPPPLPLWRVQLYTFDPELIDGVAKAEINFYWLTVAGMFAVTAAIAVAAGWALTRRIALHELTNDALAVVSHEMKTPLASTRMFIETLLERRYRGGQEQVDEYLHLIGAENARLERLVEGFHTLARLESRPGGPRLEPAPVDPAEVARSAAERLRARLDAPGCEFKICGEEGLRPFQADHAALITILVNLLDNALKYTGEDKRIELRYRADADRMVFEVSDNGIGIAPAEHQRVFERFYQSDQRLSRTHQGCGLGLSIVRTLVRAHRGTVSVVSALGKGSTFTVRLPMGPRALSCPPPTASAPEEKEPAGV